MVRRKCLVKPMVCSSLGFLLLLLLLLLFCDFKVVCGLYQRGTRPGTANMYLPGVVLGKAERPFFFMPSIKRACAEDRNMPPPLGSEPCNMMWC